MRSHLGHPDDPRRSACTLVWWGRGYPRPVRVATDPTCKRCPKAHAAAAALRAGRLAAAAGGRILVLDFDGVFNHAAFYKARCAAREAGAYEPGADAPPNLAPMPIEPPAGPRIRFTGNPPAARDDQPRAPSFDRVCVERAGRLAERVGAHVAISSSWRTARSLAGLRALLESYRFVRGLPFLAATPDHGFGEDRGGEIMSLVDELPAPPSGVVILDDDPITGPLAPFHVRTDPEAGGLTDPLVELAAAMFDRPPAPIPWRQKEAGAP